METVGMGNLFYVDVLNFTVKHALHCKDEIKFF